MFDPLSCKILMIDSENVEEGLWVRIHDEGKYQV